MVPLDKKLFWAVFIVAFTLLVAGFAKNGVQPFTAMVVVQEEPNILLLDRGFSPNEILINPGDKVVWRNDAGSDARIWSDYNGFMSKSLPSGKTLSFVFDTPGTYRYADMNSDFKGTVIVRGHADYQNNACNRDVDCDDSIPCSLDICSYSNSGCVHLVKC